MKKILLIALVLASALVSCKKNDPTPVTLQSILLGKDTLTMRVGDVRTVDCSVAPVAYDKKDLVWHSSDSTIISVTNNGTLTAKKEGNSIITVSNKTNTISVNALITVLPALPPIDSLKVGLIAYYPFNNSGDDFSGNNNNCTVYNISTAPDRHGKPDAAYHFDGATSYMTVADNQSLRLSNTDFTLNAWVKMESYNPTYGSIIICKRIVGVDNGYTFGVRGQAGPVGVITYGPGGGSNNAFGTKTVNLNQWYMVSAVYHNDTHRLSIYVNGLLDTVTENIDPNNATIDALLYIGKDNPVNDDDGYFFHGTMDDVRIYSRALSHNDILGLYAFED